MFDALDSLCLPCMTVGINMFTAYRLTALYVNFSQVCEGWNERVTRCIQCFWTIKPDHRLNGMPFIFR